MITVDCMGEWAGARSRAPLAAVAIGLSTHTAAVGRLPVLAPTLAIVAVAMCLVRGVDTLSCHRPVWVRLIAAQIVVHLLLAWPDLYSTHPAHAGVGVAPGSDLPMTVLHAVALVAGVTILGRVEQVAHPLLLTVVRRLTRPGTSRAAVDIASWRRTSGGDLAHLFPPSPALQSTLLGRAPPGLAVHLPA